MLINNIELSEFNAILKNRIIYTTNIRSALDWMEESVSGILLNQRYDWRTIRLTFLINGNTENEAYQKISLLTGALRQSTIKFDDINVEFPCVLNGSSPPERIQQGVFKLTVDLKNDWGIGELQTVSYDVEATQLKYIQIIYIRNWEETMGFTKYCFNNDEIYEQIGQNYYYIDLKQIQTSRATSWETLFTYLGIPIDAFKSINEKNGKLDINIPFSIEAAMELLNVENVFNIIYDRYQMDGYVDLPTDKTYPSQIWDTGNQQKYYFVSDVGEGWNIQDTSVEVTGRIYQPMGGSLFGYGPTGIPSDPGGEAYDGMRREGYYYYYSADNQSNTVRIIYGNGTITGNANIYRVTNTDINFASHPLRQYGLRTSNEGESPITGYMDIKYAGATQTRVETRSFILPTNLYIAYGGDAVDPTALPKELTLGGSDIARIQIWHNGELIRDYIPIGTSVKNGFVNIYDTGLYDIITMTYIPWSKLDGTIGPAPASDIIPFPSITGG